jgi:hypothetical protein
MDIMEPRRLEALREFSRRLKVLAFIGREVCRIGRRCASRLRRPLLLPVLSAPRRSTAVGRREAVAEGRPRRGDIEG